MYGPVIEDWNFGNTGGSESALGHVLVVVEADPHRLQGSWRDRPELLGVDAHGLPGGIGCPGEEVVPLGVDVLDVGAEAALAGGRDVDALTVGGEDDGAGAVIGESHGCPCL